VVLETIHASRAQTARFRMEGGLARSDVYVWETNDRYVFDQVSIVHPVNGIFTYTFDPDSLYTLTTTTGQGKGSATPPASRAFPLPYADDFEQTASNRSPKYLSDQDGAFEVHSCVGRSGKCLEQVISTKPIPWGP